MEQNLYQPLPGPDCIRLLVLQPGRREDPLTCSLEVERLYPDLHYEELSYVWEEEIPASLEQKDSVAYRRNKFDSVILFNNRSIRVTENLFAALLRLRGGPGQEARKLWIDALCIDQGNKVERGAQVAIMCHIYRGADKVLIWIGDEDDQVTPSWDALQRYARDSHRIIPHTTLRICGGAGRLAALPLRLMNKALVDPWIPMMFELFIRRFRPVRHLLRGLELSDEARANIERDILRKLWLQRVWTLQEVVVSRSALLCYGPKTMPWTDFLLFFTPFNVARIVDTENMSHLLHTKIIMEAFQDSELRLSPLLVSTWHRHATDPRDRIFALLGLLPEHSYPSLKPDYTLSEQAISIAAVKASIEIGKSLALLSIAGLRYRQGRTAPDTASWIPELTITTSPTSHGQIIPSPTSPAASSAHPPRRAS